MPKPVMHIGIDVRTKDTNKLVGKLRRLASTHSVEPAETYRQDPAWQQVHLTTTMTLEDLDDWLWKRSSVEYAGTFQREGDMQC